jgi:hypothetical protein
MKGWCTLRCRSQLKASHKPRCDDGDSKVSGCAIVWRFASTMLYPKGRKYRCGFAPCQFRFGWALRIRFVGIDTLVAEDDGSLIS